MPLEAECEGKAGKWLDVGGLEGESGEARPENVRLLGDAPEGACELRKPQAARLGHEDREVGRLEDVRIHGHVGASRLLERRLDLIRPTPDRAPREELLLRRVELTCADQRG